MMKSQKGIALYLSIVILAIILAMVLGLGAILFSQIKTIRGMGSSVVALYAADAGIEEVLDDYYGGGELDDEYSSDEFDNDSSYTVTVYCCHYQEDGCNWDQTGEDVCPLQNIDEECEATKYCIRSVGKAKEGTKAETQRAIEARLFPIEQEGDMGQNGNSGPSPDSDQDDSEGPVIANASVDPRSVPIGVALDIYAEISDPDGVTDATFYIQNPDENNIDSGPLTLFSGTVYDGDYEAQWNGPEGSYFVDISACDWDDNCSEEENI